MLMKKLLFAPIAKFSDKRLAMLVTLVGALIFSSVAGFVQHQAPSPLMVSLGLLAAGLALWLCVNYLKATWDFVRSRLRTGDRTPASLKSD